jgi:hypothetical protein
MINEDRIIVALAVLEEKHRDNADGLDRLLADLDEQDPEEEYERWDGQS